MHWATWVFFCFSCIFGCSLSVLSVRLGAEHWILEFFRFTQMCFARKSWVFFGSLKRASPWNLEFFRFTQMCFARKSWVFPIHSNVLRPEILSFSRLSTFFVHRKNSRFPCSAHFSFTGKTQDFRAQHVFRSPKKLKISVLSTFFVHRKNSRIQCSGAMLTDKTKAHNQKCKKNRKKLRLLSAFVFRSLKNILRAQNGYKRTICSVQWQKPWTFFRIY